MVGDRRERASDCRIDVVHVREQIAPGGGRMSPAARALDQPYAETAFQLLDLQADGRLRQVQAARGSRKTAKLHHVGERAQVIEAEPAHAQVFLIESIISINFTWIERPAMIP